MYLNFGELHYKVDGGSWFGRAWWHPLETFKAAHGPRELRRFPVAWRMATSMKASSFLRKFRGKNTERTTCSRKTWSMACCHSKLSTIYSQDLSSAQMLRKASVHVSTCGHVSLLPCRVFNLCLVSDKIWCLDRWNYCKHFASAELIGELLYFFYVSFFVGFVAGSVPIVFAALWS